MLTETVMSGNSRVPMFFAPLQEKMDRTVLFVLNDADEAGYFYHDLTQMMGQENAFFFPSSYRRAIKYGQKDAANEILRTEVLARLSQNPLPLCHCFHPHPPKV